MQPTPYLFFNGNCAEALSAYKDIFGGEIMENMPASEMPPEYPVPEDKKGWIMHARLKVGDGYLMVSDNIYEDSDPMAGSSVMVSLATEAEAKAAFDKLSEGGEITMAWEPTFWSAGFGTLRDRFGIRWMIGTDEMPAAG